MEFFTNIIERSGVADLFFFGCLAFWLAKFVLSQDWKDEQLNALRNGIGWVFFFFGTALLVVTIASLPQCERTRDQQTGKKQEKLEAPASKPIDQPASQTKQ